ncbi:MAG TPA: Mur ligase domain-containing protein, partial [Chloroflexota bacterium]|nr:Mur ligase domain-containing protein [Chloroflexota bacterium]
MIALTDVLAAMAPAGARLIGAPVASQFAGFAYDSRKLCPGELFLAVRTARADGHEYVADAIRRGAAGVLGDRLNPDAALGVTTIVVDDTLFALRTWAQYVLTTYAPTVVAFVGSLGKSLAAKATVAALGGGEGGDP